jgi:polyferredoxin
LGLISYDTIANDRRRAEGAPLQWRIVRPRTVLYAALWVVVGVLMLYVLATRPDLDVNVQHDRNPLFVQLSNGDVRNAYTLKILNMSQELRSFDVTVDGLPGAAIEVVGQESDEPILMVEPDRLRSYRVFVTVDGAAVTAGSTPIEIVIRDRQSGVIAREADRFQAPE